MLLDYTSYDLIFIRTTKIFHVNLFRSNGVFTSGEVSGEIEDLKKRRLKTDCPISHIYTDFNVIFEKLNALSLHVKTPLVVLDLL